MRLGTKTMEILRSQVNGSLTGDEELVLAGAIALPITRSLVEDHYDRLFGRFSAGFLNDAKSLSIKLPEGITQGASAWMSLKSDSVLSGLWKMAEVSGTGLRINLRAIPIYQETIELCEIFDINPYESPSEGAILIGSHRPGETVESLHREGIPCAIIGRADKSNDRLLYSGDICRYLERPRQYLPAIHPDRKEICPN